MLTQLHIRNYAIIQKIDISFKNGLTIITGETGAGKSILMGALSLILGERADTQVLYNKEDKCIIEGTFTISNLENVKQYLIKHELEHDNELIIRREIASNGKSRAFINDTPTTLAVLNSLAVLLIDLHRQFDTLGMQQTSEQLHLVDEVCQHKKLLHEYNVTFKSWKTLQHEYAALVEKNKHIKQELDYNQFLFSELESFNLKEDELEHIEQELSILTNSEALKLSLKQSFYSLSESDDPILSKLKKCIQDLDIHASKVELVRELKARLETTFIELKEIGSELESLYNHTNYDEEKINLLTDRLNEGNRLLKKHNLQSSNSLRLLKEQLEEKIGSAVSADEHEQTLISAITEAFKQVEAFAQKLSKSRTSKFLYIEQHINESLKKVGMPNASVQLHCETVDYNTTGMDKIDFLFDSNKTKNFLPLAKVASGGELSRIMLCIKSLLANSSALPTLIFDEIDTGISGETAVQVGSLMKELSAHHQLICITHLPQIASKAAQHLFIYKQENKEGKIHTAIKELENEERIEVLAEMLSGKQTSHQAKEMVKELMK